MKYATIRFQDQGQDFLEWDVTREGTVIDCRPYQAAIWNGSKVLNLADLKPGSLVEFKAPRINNVSTIKIPVARVVTAFNTYAVRRPRT